MQLLAEFLRYADLIRREKVKNELTSEREILIGQLEELVKQINEELTSYLKHRKTAPRGKNTPDALKTIIWINQHESVVSRFFLVRASWNHKDLKLIHFAY